MPLPEQISYGMSELSLSFLPSTENERINEGKTEWHSSKMHYITISEVPKLNSCVMGASHNLWILQIFKEYISNKQVLIIPALFFFCSKESCNHPRTITNRTSRPDHAE